MPRPSKRIRKSDFFAPARALPRLGVAPVWREDFDDEWPPISDPLEILFPAMDVAETNPLARYLGASQNDARILDASFTDSEFTITVNHYDVWRLACILSNHTWGRYDASFPVTFRFEEVSEFHVIRCVEQGVHLKVRASIADLCRAIYDIVTIVQTADSSNAKAFLVRANAYHRWRPKRGYRSFRRQGTECPGMQYDEYAILVRCAGLRIEDRSAEGWNAKFGDQHGSIFAAFDKVWPVTHWGVPDFERWLAKAQAFPEG